jgi:hypothetical protein
VTINTDLRSSRMFLPRRRLVSRLNSRLAVGDSARAVIYLARASARDVTARSKSSMESSGIAP